MPSLIVHSTPPPRDDLAVDDDVGAGGIEQAQVLERVAVDDEQVGGEADAHLAEPVAQPEQPRAVDRRVRDHFEGMEAGLLVQLELAHQAEAVERVDVARRRRRS